MKWGFEIKTLEEWACEHCGAEDIDHVWECEPGVWAAQCAWCGWDQPAPQFETE